MGTVQAPEKGVRVKATSQKRCSGAVLKAGKGLPVGKDLGMDSHSGRTSTTNLRNSMGVHKEIYLCGYDRFKTFSSILIASCRILRFCGVGIEVGMEKGRSWSFLGKLAKFSLNIRSNSL